MGKLSIKDLKDLVSEIEFAANNKDRTIEDVSNKKVKEYLLATGDNLIVSDVTNKILSGAVGVATYSAVSGALAPTVALPVVYSITAAETGAVIAGPIGAPVPIVGPIVAAAIGATVGVAIGVTSGIILNVKQKKETKELISDIFSKQNLVHMYIEKEIVEIAKKKGKKANSDKRYIYLISLIAANEELKKINVK